MKPPRTSKQHCRCTSKKACGKRFKGLPGVTCCPHCGAAGRLDKWADSKPWREPEKLCSCGGVNGAYAWKDGSPHRLGSPGCLGAVPAGEPNTYDEEYGF